MFAHVILQWQIIVCLSLSLFLFFKYGDEANGTYADRWSVPELKERQSNISVFSRIFEEYTDAEHFLEFTRKTAAILFQTSKHIVMKSLNKYHHK
jgi:hypothetical protein